MFDESPFIAFWETTQACELACRHCRACAQPARDPLELSTDEARGLMQSLKRMGCPLLVLTGGDPAQREDLCELVQYGTELGLRVALTPSATERVTTDVLSALARAGLSRIAVSIDGATPASHDAFRGVAGSWERSVWLLREARALGLTTQVNSTVTRYNVDELEALAAMIEPLGIELWSVFFVVPTGRAKSEDVLLPDDVERVLERLATLSERAPFDVKTTAAPHFRRVLLQRKLRRDDVVGVRDGIGRAPRGVNDGQGIVFVSHRGDVSPSGFLPVPCGNVRTHDLSEIYREHPLFTALRDPDRLGGKCGECEFRKVCGGSRARAFALTGDPLAEEPSCAYVPRGASEDEPSARRAVTRARRDERAPLLVIGAGVSGLSAALTALRAQPGADLRLIDADTRPGGVVRTERLAGGWLIEEGPDAIAMKPNAAALLDALGLSEQLVRSGPAPRRSFVLRDGALLAVPPGVMSMSMRGAAPMLSSGLLSARGRLRLLAEPTVAARRDAVDESVGAFITRRFGAEFLSVIVEPLLRGMYGAPASELSVRAVLPQLAAMESSAGSVANAMLREPESGKAAFDLAALRDGMESLPRALALAIGQRFTGAITARSIERTRGGWRVHTERDGAIEAARVVLATPPWITARLVERAAPVLAAELHEVTSSGLATVTLGVKREQIAHPLDGTGWVTAASEQGAVEACTWASRKWPGRAPEGHELIRCFLRKDLPDGEDLAALAVESLARVLGLSGAPLFSIVRRRARVLPVYRVGHAEREARVRAMLPAFEGLTLAGNTFGGMGLADCIASGASSVRGVNAPAQ